MPKGMHGVRDFTDIDINSTPKQLCDLPHEGDPFCGNDNNRRAYEKKMQREREAQGIAEPEVVPVVPVVEDEQPTDAPVEEVQPPAPISAPAWKPGR